MKRFVQIIEAGALAFLTALAISIYSRETVFDGYTVLDRLNNNLDYLYFNDALCFVAVFALYLGGGIRKKENCFISMVPAFLFSVFMLIGKSYLDLGNWDFILRDGIQIIISSVVFCGFFVMFYIIIKSLLIYVHDKHFLLFNISGEKNYFKFNSIERHIWGIGFWVLIICWLPYVLINFPGSLPYDGYRQLNMFMGVQTMTNHHPFAMTVLLGSIFKIGRHINDNFGIFLIVLFNGAFCAGVYSYACKKIYVWGYKIQVSLAVLSFFALVPMWGAYVQAVIKDTLFFAIFLLWIIKLIDLFEVIIQGKSENKNEWIFYFVTSLGMILSRNNGVYIVLPITFLLIFVTKNRNRISVLVLFTVLLCFNSIYNNAVLPLCGVEPGSIKEMLSVPFQQTARYVKYFGDDLSLEEENIIDKVLDFDILATKYNPDKADPIKDSMRAEVTGSDLEQFLGVWLQMLKRHPGVFVQATLNNTYGYYYPFYQCEVLLTYNYYIEKKENVNTGDFNIFYVNLNRGLRDSLIAYSDFWQIAPGISLLVSPGFYTWLLVLLIVVVVSYRKWKMLVILSALVLHVGVCLASPVNGLLRYAMPLMAAMPFCILWVFKEIGIHQYQDGDKKHVL